ncbi:uncharacterized protein BDZ99DRAFT_521891 [Mytilinidion resinicola]|uniref:Uncharacterized protein n=1 Tax=Mytilinidion resinicola TaxID=574789 RepID=A0A6A6YK46_9PEZI|nr:uncharacterized protein BDZ99DRAFT_521891 [Mytilinidion resinicola]KAF2808334.1 hypothetical protein BDZ99DRAFT_521891 [Mytilinidion resinicola]
MRGSADRPDNLGEKEQFPDPRAVRKASDANLSGDWLIWADAMMGKLQQVTPVTLVTLQQVLEGLKLHLHLRQAGSSAAIAVRKDRSFMVKRRPHDACDTPTLTSMVADQTGIQQDAALVADRQPAVLRAANQNSRRSCVLGAFLAAADGRSTVRQPRTVKPLLLTQRGCGQQGMMIDAQRRSATLFAFPGQSPTRILRAPSALGLATGKGDGNNAGGRHSAEAVGATLTGTRGMEKMAPYFYNKLFRVCTCLPLLRVLQCIFKNLKEIEALHPGLCGNSLELPQAVADRGTDET